MKNTGKTDASEAQDPPESAWKYAHVGWQLGLTLLGFGAVGYWIDSRFSLSPWFTITGTFLGFAAGLYHLIRTVR